MTERRAYSSTVVSPATVAFVVLVTVGLDIALFALDAWWLVAPVTLLLAFTASYSAVVRLAVTPEQVLLGNGLYRWPTRRVEVCDIVSASSGEVTGLQALGVGERFVKSTRLTVGRGPILILELRSGEQIRISTPHPADALEVLHIANHPNQEGAS